ncbi:M15 family metallopeptidase [Thalassomonas haliotis]|uniref:M15 family metallopeptidase n=2 Tax=Thalassomonas haliotis TaxID=485448 RepID=A0ABY7VN58_9GAMM|nr:M15 family metallopeptidase [Thalassomonas haliotis]
MNEQQLTGQTDSHIHFLNQGPGLHREMLPAWQAMQQAAKDAGFNLTIASGFRDFSRQLSIWNRKFCGELAVKDDNNKLVALQNLSEQACIHAIMRFSALPGTSRHHWGTDIDIYADNLLAPGQKLQLEPWEYQQDGPFVPLRQWLEANCRKFGFYFPYDIDRGGVAAEPWHLSYAPLAQQCQQSFTLELLTTALAGQEISGKNTILALLPELYQQYIINTAEVDFE